MMVFTAKVKKKNLIILGAAILAILLVILWPGKKDTQIGMPPEELDASQNENRVRFLESFGWQISSEPTETGSVRVPVEENGHGVTQAISLIFEKDAEEVEK